MHACLSVNNRYIAVGTITSIHRNQVTDVCRVKYIHIGTYIHPTIRYYGVIVVSLPAEMHIHSDLARVLIIISRYVYLERVRNGGSTYDN